MDEPELPLDEALRGRLLALAEQEDGPTVHASAPHELAIRRTLARVRARRRARVAGWGAALAAAAALPLLLTRPWASEAPGAPVTAEGPRAREASKAVAPQARCALAQALTEARFVDDGDAQTLTLGTHASVRASSDARVTPRLGEPCTAELALDAGRVSVHARDLAGGSLVVRAGDARVVVTGTIFSVARRDGAVTVELAEGRLRIERDRLPAETLSAGERALIAGDQLQREALSEEARRALLSEHGVAVPEPSEAPSPVSAEDAPEQAAPEAADATVSDAARAEQTAPRARERDAAKASPDALLSRADAEARRGGVNQARELYRRAGAGSGMAAEVAWVRLCQLELESGRLAAAAAALETYERRFPRGALGAEAAWTAVRVARRRGDAGAAERAARRLIDEHPRSPQAAAARRMLGEPAP